MFKRLTMAAAFAATTIAIPAALSAKEYPIGKPQMKNGMEIAAVYLQPIEMMPAGVMRDAKDSDIHLEADIKAAKDNVNGFAEGDWMPYLAVTFELTKEGSDFKLAGDLMPMVANDGPHYGDNVKLAGPGKYKLVVKIGSPEENKMSHFGHHVDKETGVAALFKPFTTEYEFIFAGTGKKGAY